ncbi:hypothetical protein THII_2500 [Thioploca ingrica]|uniref:Uncharacterized protein n=1 Tax=Thioploca ingrica TaxID=40754 RepID=A0A090ALV3_9GAMM|nr:hypothetical protein THII_2500 [Thioploca ingrica]
MFRSHCSPGWRISWAVHCHLSKENSAALSPVRVKLFNFRLSLPLLLRIKVCGSLEPTPSVTEPKSYSVGVSSNCACPAAMALACRATVDTGSSGWSLNLKVNSACFSPATVGVKTVLNRQ